MSLPRPRPQLVTIPGPVGQLQVVLEDPHTPGGQTSLQTNGATAPTKRFAVICHPHPQFGGTLDNKVVHTLARTFQELDLPTLRFNFRGVGASQGDYAQGIGETDDAVAVADWGATRWPGAQLWLAGFSFGSFVALRASARRAPERLVTVAPAVQRFDFNALHPPSCPWLVIQGDQDEIVDSAEVLNWARQLSPAPAVVMIPGATHFFHGKLTELRTAVQEWVKSAGAEKQQR